MATATTNVYAERARAEKVAALATTAAANGLTADMLERAEPAEWRTLARIAAVREPSPETQGRVLATLREAERTKQPARPTTDYRLPDGRVVGIYSDVARGEERVSYQTGGRVVEAVRADLPVERLCVRCKQPVATPDPVYMFPVHTACLRDEPKPVLPEGVTYVEDIRYQEWSGEPAAVEQAAAERVGWAESPEGHAHGAHVRRDTDGRRVVVTWWPLGG